LQKNLHLGPKKEEKPNEGQEGTISSGRGRKMKSGADSVVYKFFIEERGTGQGVVESGGNKKKKARDQGQRGHPLIGGKPGGLKKKVRNTGRDKGEIGVFIVRKGGRGMRHKKRPRIRTRGQRLASVPGEK